MDGSAIGCKFESYIYKLTIATSLESVLTINIVVDFVTNGIASVTFPSSSTVGAIECIQISIIDDDTVEGIENFFVFATSSDPVVEINPQGNQTIVSIVDDDGETSVIDLIKC